MEQSFFEMGEKNEKNEVLAVATLLYAWFERLRQSGHGNGAAGSRSKRHSG